MAIRPAVKYGGIALIAVGAVAAAAIYLPKTAAIQAFIPQKTQTTNIVVKDTPAYTYDLPVAPENGFSGCPTVLSIPWNGMSDLALANGDVTTTPDSLLKKYSGGCLKLQRQDDYGVMEAEMLKFSSAYAANGDESQGAPMFIIMADGAPGVMRALKPSMDKLKQQAVVIDTLGFSYGEDKCMIAGINGNPQNAKGALVAAVPRDGDENICVKAASDNGIKINPVNSTYDKDALNLAGVNSFTDADTAYITGTSQTRDEVVNGVLTGKKVTVAVNGVATWTPGDVAVFQKGGLQTWASTKDYNQQMGAALVVNKAWALKHHDFIVGVLRAVDRASVEMRTTPNGLKKAAIVMAAVHGTASDGSNKPEFWSKYFVGYTDTDKQGNKVALGGSRVVGLAEAQEYFGLTAGGYNVYKGVYDTFTGYNVKMYPNDSKNTPAYEDVVDTQFVTDAMAGVQVQHNTAAAATSSSASSITNVVSQQSVSIEFLTGSATLSPSSLAKLHQLADSIAMTNLLIKIDGHTDNTGNSDANQDLSVARAQAVADYLTKLSSVEFPTSRFQVTGHGDLVPVDPSADQNSAAARAANRRVVITLGN